MAKRGRPKRFNIDWNNYAERSAYERKKYRERREAKGLKYYPRERRAIQENKQCRSCEKILAIENFRPLKGHHVGFRSVCRSCENAPRNNRKKQFTKWGFPKIKRAGLLASQPYCMICLSAENLRLDHCHTAKMPRAVLCNGCNTGLGAFRDDPALLRNAIAYLEWFKELHMLPYYREYWACK